MLIGHFIPKVPMLAFVCSQHRDWRVRSICVILMFQNHELRSLLFLINGDLADGCFRFRVWAVGVQDETKHLLGLVDPSQPPPPPPSTMFLKEEIIISRKPEIIQDFFPLSEP